MGSAVTHNICTPLADSTDVMDKDGGYTIMHGQDLVFSILPSDDKTYTITGLLCPIGGHCVDDVECAENLTCNGDNTCCLFCGCKLTVDCEEIQIC
jgi:hypothetical protein